MAIIEQILISHKDKLGQKLGIRFFGTQLEPVFKKFFKESDCELFFYCLEKPQKEPVA